MSTDRNTFADILDLALPMYRKALAAAPDPLLAAAAFGATLADFVQTQVTPEMPAHEVVVEFMKLVKLSGRPRRSTRKGSHQALTSGVSSEA